MRTASDYIGSKKAMKQQHKTSFTLSEVLISLVIIGIIAAITFPLIYANYQEKAIKSSLKKNYSVLQQALDRYYIDNGCKLTSQDVISDSAKSKIIKYFNVINDCSEYNNSRCIQSDSQTYKTYNGKCCVNMGVFDDGQFILNDNSFIMIENDIQHKAGNFYISVDVNGFNKKPNSLGKDLFMFQISEEGELIPMGESRTNYTYNAYCSKTSSGSLNGAGCTHKILSGD